MISPENIELLLEIISEDPIFKLNLVNYPELKDQCLNALMNFY